MPAMTAVPEPTTAAVGAAEGDTLPAAGQQGYVRAIVPVKQLYSRINVSGKAIAATKSPITPTSGTRALTVT